jgi:hypothetical protein
MVVSQTACRVPALASVDGSRSSATVSPDAPEARSSARRTSAGRLQADRDDGHAGVRLAPQGVEQRIDVHRQLLSR